MNSSNELALTNTSDLSSIGVSVAGAVSTNSNAGSGAAMVLTDVSHQKNYIDNSTINAGKVTFDSDKIIDTLGLTGRTYYRYLY